METGDYNKYKEELRKINLTIPLNGYRNDIKQLLIKFNLSKHFERSIEIYLLCNDFSFLGMHNLRIKTEADKNGEQRLYLEIFSDTTMKDIQESWNFIQGLQKKIERL